MRFLALLCLMISMMTTPVMAEMVERQYQPPVYVPDELSQWVDWVRDKDTHYSCPKSASQKQACIWPEALEITLLKDGATFTQVWNVWTKPGESTKIPLPGRTAEAWPEEVSYQFNGELTSALVQTTGSSPFINVESEGQYTTSGRFYWKQPPSSLTVSPILGLVSVTNRRLDTSTKSPSNGRVWLAQQHIRPSKNIAKTQDTIQLEVYRLFEDRVPTVVTTRYVLQVSGKKRLITLPASLPNTSVYHISSSLPTKFSGNTLQLQARSGTYDIFVTSRFDTVQDALVYTTPIEYVDNWPQAEYWSIKQRTDLRHTKLSSEKAEQITASLSSIPKEWQGYPAFRMVDGSVVSVTELQRGVQNTAENQLHLSRMIVVDPSLSFSTFQDDLSGTFEDGWRLNIQPGLKVQSISLDNQPKLITEFEKSLGIEVRSTNIRLQSSGTLDSLETLPVSGWETPIEDVDLELYIPTGTTLLHVSNVDSAHGSWMSRWSLYRIFLCILVVVVTYKVFGFRSALLSILVFGISSMTLPLIAGVLVLAVFRILLDYFKDVRWLQRLHFISLLCFSLGCLLPVKSLLVDTIYPQLQYSSKLHQSSHVRKAQRVVEERYYDEMENSNIKQEVLSSALPMASSVLSSKSLQKSVEADSYRGYAPKAVKKQRQNLQIQTGPGIPTELGQRYYLTKNTVSKDDTLTIHLASVTETRIMNFMQALSIVGLLFIFWMRTFGRNQQFLKRLPSFFRGRTLASVIGVCMLSMVAAPENSVAAEFPSPAILKELKTKINQPPKPASCTTNCAVLVNAEVYADAETLTLRLHYTATVPTAIRLPGPVSSWSPKAVTVDDNLPRGIRSENGVLEVFLDAGTHVVQMSGKLSTETTTVQFSRIPERVTTTTIPEDIELSGINRSGKMSSDLLTFQKLSVVEMQTSKDAEETFVSNIQNLKPFVTVSRSLLFQETLASSSYANLISASARSQQIDIPLLAGEQVVESTAGQMVIDSNGRSVLRVKLNSRNSYVGWSSTFPSIDSSSYTLTASKDASIIETWNVSADDLWHIQYDGLTPSSILTHGEAQLQWQPRPEEQVHLSPTALNGADGEVLTIDSARMTSVVGSDIESLSVNLQVRATQSRIITLQVPDDLSIRAFEINSRSLPLPVIENSQIRLPVSTDTKSVLLRFQRPSTSNFLYSSPALKLDGQKLSNVNIDVEFNDQRWILWTDGPFIGPVVQIWSELFILLLFVFGLSYLKTPLKMWSWLLLLLGFMHVGYTTLLIVLSWFVALQLRDHYKEKLYQRPRRFQATQLGLIFLTLCFIFGLLSAVHTGLLGSPKMNITGNNSYAGNLYWYQTGKSLSEISVQVFAIPRLLYQGLMLLWSIWLALAITKWIKWGWSIYASPSAWVSVPKVRATMKDTVEDEEDSNELPEGIQEELEKQ